MNNVRFRRAFKTVFAAALIVAAFAISSAKSFAVGVVDKNFGTNGITTVNVGANAAASSLVLQPDGKIVVAGSYAADGAGIDGALVRYNQNGSPDLGFGGSGVARVQISVRDDVFNAVAIQPNGKIVIVGSTQNAADPTGTDFLIARFNPNGSLDSSFGSGGFVIINQDSNDRLDAVAATADGKIVAAGRTSQNTGEAAIFRFTSNGALDSSFGTNGAVYLNIANLRSENFTDLELLASGRLLVGGTSFFFNNPAAYQILAVFENNGVLAQDFGEQGVATRSTNHQGFLPRLEIELLPDNKILTNDQRDTRLYLSNGTGANVFPFFPESSSIAKFANGNYAIAQRSNGFLGDAVLVYNNQNKAVGQAPNFFLRKNLVQSDNKIVSLNGGFGLQRFSVTSQGTRAASSIEANVRNERTDFSVYRPSNRNYYRHAMPSMLPSPLTLELSQNVTKLIRERSLNRFFVSSSSFYSWHAEPNAGALGYFRNLADASAQPLQWGISGDVPVGGDYDGDGITDYTVFRPSDGIWYVLQSSDNQPRYIRWGQVGDKLVPADYDYDGTTDAAVFRPSNGFWYVLNSSDGFRAAEFGISTDEPIPGDYDGDGRHDFAVFRNGIWHVAGSTRGYFGLQWGAPGDVPISVRY